MLPNWIERPRIVASLMNPAFCGKLIHSFVKGYNNQRTRKCSFALAFFALPLILHEDTRNTIPLSRFRKTLHAWLDENPQIKVGLAGRIINNVIFTREAIMLLVSVGSLVIDNSGNLEERKIGNNLTSDFDLTEVTECFTKAESLGKCFSRSGSDQTIFSIIGVKP